MLAHDFSPCSDVATTEAARICAGLGARLLLLHTHLTLVLRPEEQWGEETYKLDESLRTQLKGIAAGLREKHPGLVVDVDVVTTKDIASGILDEANRLGVNHLVLGTHGRKGLQHLVLGSVAERVAKEATMPVTIVRAAKA
jgi:nucleotide-binding universal stress UspA family protein